MMQKLMNRRSKKGFTLVELIVVIAILAILSAIAVPRLMGFQDRARQQADKQTGVVIRNAIALLYSNGELKLTDGGKYTITKATGTTVVTGINTDPAGTLDGAGVETLVETMTDPLLSQGNVDIVVTVQADGEVVVTSP